MYDLWDTACKRNGFIEYIFVLSVEQSLCWQIEYKIFLYYLLCMICGTLHLKEMVSLNISSFLVRNNLCAGKLSIRSFFLFTRYDLWETACKRNGFINIASFLVGNSLRAGKLSIRSFFIIFYV